MTPSSPTGGRRMPPFGRSAWLLGLAGWVPLAVLLAAAGLFSDDQDGGRLFVRLAVVYAGAIFSFLGGVQWGLALRGTESPARHRRLWLSVVPSLLAVLAIMLPPPQGLLVLLPGFLALLVYELLERGDGTLPRWFRPLRVVLSLLVALTLGALLPLT